MKLTRALSIAAQQLVFVIGSSLVGGCDGAGQGPADDSAGGAFVELTGSTPGAQRPSASGEPNDAGSAPVSRVDAGSGPLGHSPDAALPVGDWGAGDYPPALREQVYIPIEGVKGQGELVRGYKVHVPASYRPELPTPLVFAIHGLGQNAVMFAVDGGAWPEKSDAEGFILVMPTGNVRNADGSWGVLGSWNAGECCGGAAESGIDDVALIRAILADVQKHLHVDTRRVYATGFSNGGFLSFRLACEASDLFAAVAPASGGIGSPSISPMGAGNSNFTRCAPSAPVSVLAVHGDGDPIVSYAYMAPSLALFAAANGCSERTAPAQVPASGGDTTCVTYTGCPAGVEVTGCTVKSGGHCWFGSDTCGFGVDLGTLLGNNSDTLNDTDAAWAFLKRFAKP